MREARIGCWDVVLTSRFIAGAGGGTVVATGAVGATGARKECPPDGAPEVTGAAQMADLSTDPVRRNLAALMVSSIGYGSSG
jgi:hypothetical protein